MVLDPLNSNENYTHNHKYQPILHTEPEPEFDHCTPIELITQLPVINIPFTGNTTVDVVSDSEESTVEESNGL